MSFTFLHAYCLYVHSDAQERKPDFKLTGKRKYKEVTTLEVGLVSFSPKSPLQKMKRKISHLPIAKGFIHS